MASMLQAIIEDPSPGPSILPERKLPCIYKRVEWWDSHEGALPNGDVEYPVLDNAAAFVCGEHSCSPPVFSAEKLASVAGKR